MKTFLEMFDENYYSIKEQVISHETGNMLDTSYSELRMYIDESNNISFIISSDYSGHMVVHEDYIVLSSRDIGNYSVWDYLPDLSELLTEEGIADIKEKVPVPNDKAVKAYLVNNHPDWIKGWINEALPDIKDYLDTSVEPYLENLRYRIEAEIENYGMSD